MTIQHHLATPPPPISLAAPTTWQACRDYWHSQQLAHSLELTERQASFIDPRPKSATWYHWGLYYPLSCLAFLALLAIIRPIVPSVIGDPLNIVLVCLLVFLLPFAVIALSFTLFRRTLLHCEQIHLYANGFVAIDPRGRRQGARYDQLFDFRREPGHFRFPQPLAEWFDRTIRGAERNDLMTTITILDESTAGETHVWNLDFLDETISLRELIRQRIYQEVTEYNAKRSGHFCGLVQPTEAERTLNGLRLKSEHQLDWQAQYEKAIDAFTRRGYLILVDKKQVVDLDTLIELHARTEVTFFKLVPLVGG